MYQNSSKVNIPAKQRFTADNLAAKLAVPVNQFEYTCPWYIKKAFKSLV